MSRPLQENLEVVEEQGNEWVQCAACGRRLCGAGEDWREACVTRLLPPGRMGPFREIMEGRAMLQERYCPGCGVSLDAAVIVKEERPMQRTAPNRVTPEPLALDAGSTAVVVLDLNTKAEDPSQPPQPLIRPARAFLDKARAASVPVVYTVVVWEKGTPHGEAARALARRSDEPILYPNGYDKFLGGELRELLEGWGTGTLVFLGGAANFALLYTATTAARTFGYTVVVPLDGIYALSDYEMEYTLHQFTVLPRVADKFRFSRLGAIEFRQEPVGRH